MCLYSRIINMKSKAKEHYVDYKQNLQYTQLTKAY